MTKPIVIIGCGAAKRDLEPGATCPIVELYNGSLYRARLAYADVIGGADFVISAQHGLVSADRQVGTYERDLRKLSKIEREAWFWRVTDGLRAIPKDARIVLLASGPYADWTAWARREGWTIEEPTKGMTLGQSISFLRTAAKELAPRINVTALADEVEAEWESWSDEEDASMPVAVLRELVRRAAMKRAA